jgi:hypothetical protein
MYRARTVVMLPSGQRLYGKTGDPITMDQYNEGCKSLKDLLPNLSYFELTLNDDDITKAYIPKQAINNSVIILELIEE